MRDHQRELLLIIGVGAAGLIVFALIITAYLITHE